MRRLAPLVLLCGFTCNTAPRLLGGGDSNNPSFSSVTLTGALGVSSGSGCLNLPGGASACGVNIPSGNRGIEFTLNTLEGVSASGFPYTFWPGPPDGGGVEGSGPLVSFDSAYNIWLWGAPSANNQGGLVAGLYDAGINITGSCGGGGGAGGAYCSDLSIGDFGPRNAGSYAVSIFNGGVPYASPDTTSNGLTSYITVDGNMWLAGNLSSTVGPTAPIMFADGGPVTGNWGTVVGLVSTLGTASEFYHDGGSGGGVVFSAAPYCQCTCNIGATAAQLKCTATTQAVTITDQVAGCTTAAYSCTGPH
jgi:hypothetical protein